MGLFLMYCSLVSVERVVEYLHVTQEAPAVVPSNRPPAYWPSSNGELSVENLVVKYAPDLPPVLHGITFTIKPTEKVGVVSEIPCFICRTTKWNHLLCNNRSEGLGQGNPP